MKAARLHAYRRPESLAYEDAPDPRAGADEVLVRVHAGGVTRSELGWAPTSTTRTGQPRPLPIVLGHEFSGVVAAIGAGVSGLAPGDAVYGLNDWFADGAGAELCLAKASEVARKPTSLDHTQAAVVPISGLTAWQGLFERGRLERGQRVLVHGGAGAVGVFAVQLAHWRGAHVTTTVSARSADVVRSLGADVALDYHTTRFDDVVRNVDVVFDTVGGETLGRSQAVLAPGGRLVTVAAGQPQDETHAAFFLVRADAGQLAELARMLDAGILRPIVDAVFPLARAADAYTHRTTSGKAVIRVVPP